MREAGEGERSEDPDERGAQRRSEEDAAVEPAMRSNVATSVSGRHAAVSAASRRASGARGGARDTRPKGRDRASGLGRVARSRSDAPRLIVCIGEPVSIFGTVNTITVCTIGFTDIGTVAFSTIIMRGTDSRVIVECCDARLMSGRA